jgi:hypothetical protein
MSLIVKIGDKTVTSTTTPSKDIVRSNRREQFDQNLIGTLDQANRPTPNREAINNYLSEDEGSRKRTLEELRTLVQAIQSGTTDPWELTDLIFYARHPDLVDVPLTKDHQDLLDEWNSISALLVHPTLNEVGNYIGVNLLDKEEKGSISSAFERAFKSPLHTGNQGTTTKYDDLIVNAVEWCPGLSPAILKSLLAQESNFNPDVINKYGYAGIAQFGRSEAHEVGLKVGIAGTSSDERLNPSKAIPAAARLLNIKAERLGEMAFSKYGQPEGTEFWKFVLAAYNGGEGTVTLAMGHAYRKGLAQAKADGLVGSDAVIFARRYASRWENLKIGGITSPLGLAAMRYFPSIAESKFHEIGMYPVSIVERTLGNR